MDIDDTGSLTLLVEQDRTLGNCITEALKKARPDAQVVRVRDGQAALDFLSPENQYARRLNGQRLALVVLDLNLAGLPAIEVLRRGKASAATQTIPFVVLASPYERHLIAKSYELGANACLGKSADPYRLGQDIQLAGLFWLMVNVMSQQQTMAR